MQPGNLEGMRAPGARDGPGRRARTRRRRERRSSDEASPFSPSVAGVGGSAAPAARALLMLALALALVSQAPLRAGAVRADAAGPLPSATSAATATMTQTPLPPAPAPPPKSSASAGVASPAELLAALEDPAVGTVVLSRSVRLPVGWGPAVISRPVTITSSIRAVVDFCAGGCANNATTGGAAGGGPADVVRLVVAPSGTLSFHRVFLRDWVPPEGSPAATAAARDAAAAGDEEAEEGEGPEPEEAAAASAAAALAAAARGPDVATSPLPGVRLMPGAGLSMSLAAIHWTADSMWLLSAAGGWWRRAADAGAINALEGDGRGAVPGPRADDGHPRLHGIKAYSADGRGGRSVQMSDCYMPFDLYGCLERDAPFDVALVYCVSCCVFGFFCGAAISLSLCRATAAARTQQLTPHPPVPTTTPHNVNKKPNKKTALHHLRRPAQPARRPRPRLPPGRARPSRLLAPPPAGGVAAGPGGPLLA